MALQHHHPEHGHSHDHGHSHGSAHSHAHAGPQMVAGGHSHAQAAPIAASLLRLSAGLRIALAACLSAAIWLGVYWAVR